jgi:hypothetical protein
MVRMIVNGEVGKKLRKSVGMLAEVLIGNVQSKDWSVMLADLWTLNGSCVVVECPRIDSCFYEMWQWPIFFLISDKFFSRCAHFQSQFKLLLLLLPWIRLSLFRSQISVHLFLGMTNGTEFPLLICKLSWSYKYFKTLFSLKSI